MPIDEIIQPPEAEAPEPVLELGEAPETIEGAEHVEPLDEAEFPDTFDEQAGEETPLVKHLREQLKERTRELRRVSEQGGKPAIVRTKRPDLWEDPEISGDTDKYDAALLAWQDNERKADEAEQSRNSEQQQTAQAWEQELQTYKTNAIKLGKPDFDTAEGTVVSVLSNAQQTTIVMAAKDPARFIYALGRSPNRLTQLAQITNPIKLAAEVARIEGVRTMARKEPPAIDTPLQGHARLSTPEKNKEESKQIEAAGKSGDIDALRAWRKSQKKAA